MVFKINQKWQGLYNMKDIAVKVSSLTKVYKIFNAPVDRIKEAIHPFGKKYSRDFYALNDVSFSIKKGETVGIVGKNGAGKSTILKIITGVLTPTSGRVDTNGHISSLLELGAGFNPEMTGKENIYLNGTLMGYSKTEMDSKLSSIISFADIGEFIDQPVKMYSSGMFARLAFSVAISVNPDILIVDEALSVGDVAFQYKCFKRMKEIKERGATILLVTHSTQQVAQNCDRVIVMSKGSVLLDTYDVKHGIAEYEKLMRNITDSNQSDEDIMDDSESGDLQENISMSFDTSPNRDVDEHRMGSFRAIIQQVSLSDKKFSMKDAATIESGNRYYMNFHIISKYDINDVVLGVSLRGREGVDLWGDNNLAAETPIVLKKGRNKICYEFTMNLKAGDYLLCAGLASMENTEREELDQRWPIRIVHVLSRREAVGIAFAPITVYLQE